MTQLGARRHYIVPRAFANANLLTRFYTDIYVNSVHRRDVMFRVGRMLRWQALCRLSGRNDQGVPSEFVKAFTRFGVRNRWRLLRARTVEEKIAIWTDSGEQFCRLVLRELNDAYETLFAYSSAALELFEYGHSVGRRCVLDHATAPLHAEMGLVIEESERFDGWSNMARVVSGIELYRERQKRERDLADVVICGSTFARRLVEAEGFPGDRIETIPLAVVSEGVTRDKVRFDSGGIRVIFVGDDGLRKGIGYLSMAIEMLDSGRIQARVAGDLGITPYGLSALSKNLELLGPVPRTQIEEIYRWADVLVLPSVSDTFGIVMLEAMSHGVPVIATPNTGGPDVIRDGVDGYIVPIRDPEAIAAKLDFLATHPDTLSEMSRSAIERVRYFSAQRYCERLIEVTLGDGR